MKHAAWLAVLAACGGRFDAPDAAVDAAPAETGAPDASQVDAGFTPASLSNLVLWLDASELVGVSSDGSVTGWGDRSPYQNDASTTKKYAPSFVASGIGGRPTIHFDAESAVARYLLVADAPSLRFGTGDYVLAIVARYTNAPSDGLATGAAAFFWKSTYGSPSGSGLTLWGNVPISDGTVKDGLLLLEDEHDYDAASGAYHDGTPHLFVARRASGALELRVDETAVATATETSPVDVSATGTPVSIGAVSFAYDRLFGDISEIVALAGPTTPSDLAGLEAYLQTKYNLL